MDVKKNPLQVRNNENVQSVSGILLRNKQPKLQEKITLSHNKKYIKSNNENTNTYDEASKTPTRLKTGHNNNNLITRSDNKKANVVINTSKSLKQPTEVIHRIKTPTKNRDLTPNQTTKTSKSKTPPPLSAEEHQLINQQQLLEQEHEKIKQEEEQRLNQIRRSRQLNQFLILMHAKIHYKQQVAYSLSLQVLSCNVRQTKIQENFADQLRSLNLKKNLLRKLNQAGTEMKLRRLRARNLARMFHYSINEAKVRTLKDAIKRIKNMKKQPFFRTNKRAKVSKPVKAKGVIETKLESLTDPRQVESIKKELGWDMTTTVVQKKIKQAFEISGHTAINKGLKNSRNGSIKNSKAGNNSPRSKNSRSKTQLDNRNVGFVDHLDIEFNDHVKNTSLRNYEKYRIENEDDQDQDIVQRRKSNRMLVCDSLDKTEFGNSKVDMYMAVSKSTNFIPYLNIDKINRKDFDGFEETSNLNFKNTKISKNLSGSKSQAGRIGAGDPYCMDNDQISNFDRNNYYDMQNISANKRRQSMSRTKSFVDTSSGLKVKNSSDVQVVGDKSDNTATYSLFQNSSLANSEFRKHELEARLGGESSCNFANMEKGPKSSRSQINIGNNSKDSESCIDDEIDCISTTIRKLFIQLKKYYF